MVAHEKSIWFGCVLAASLFVLVLAGCADVSSSCYVSRTALLGGAVTLCTPLLPRWAYLKP
jgi:hypothetical protein